MQAGLASHCYYSDGWFSYYLFGLGVFKVKTLDNRYEIKKI